MESTTNNYEDRIVCFMDILAFKQLIESTIQDDLEVYEQTEFIKSLFRIMIEELKNDRLEIQLSNGEFEKAIKVTHFSDSIVLSVSLKEESALFYTLNGLQFFLLELLKHRIFLRGGITIGKLYHDGSTVFGPALNEAYKLESETAIYPRIIMHPSTIDSYLDNSLIRHDSETEKEYLYDLLSCDNDGYCFVDYFNVDFTQFDSEYDGIYYMEYLRNLIIENIKNYDSVKKIYKKNTWMIKKYNKMIVDKNREYRIRFQHKYGIQKIERKKLFE